MVIYRRECWCETSAHRKGKRHIKGSSLMAIDITAGKQEVKSAGSTCIRRKYTSVISDHISEQPIRQWPIERWKSPISITTAMFTAI